MRMFQRRVFSSVAGDAKVLYKGNLPHGYGAVPIRSVSDDHALWAGHVQKWGCRTQRTSRFNSTKCHYTIKKRWNPRQLGTGERGRLCAWQNRPNLSTPQAPPTLRTRPSLPRLTRVMTTRCRTGWPACTTFWCFVIVCPLWTSGREEAS